MCVPPRNKPQIPCSCSFNVKAGVAGPRALANVIFWKKHPKIKMEMSNLILSEIYNYIHTCVYIYICIHMCHIMHIYFCFGQVIVGAGYVS